MVKLSRKRKERAVNVKRLDAEACKREIARLARKGTCTPEAVVESARDADSAMHDYFEWDN